VTACEYCLRRILRIPWWARISNEDVRRSPTVADMLTDQPPLIGIIHISYLKSSAVLYYTVV